MRRFISKITYKTGILILALIIVGISSYLIDKQFNVSPKLSKLGGDVAGIFNELTTPTKFTGVTMANAAGTAPYQEVGGTVYIEDNVGIGTANPVDAPGTTLDVNGGIRTNAYIQTKNFGTLTYSSNTYRLESLTGIPLSFGVNGAHDSMYLATSGNVGIGTISPASKLNVNVTRAEADGGLAAFNVFDGYYNYHIGWANTGANGLSLYGNTSQFYVDTRNGEVLHLAQSGSPKLTINGGKVGIGTVSPIVAGLHVNNPDNANTYLKLTNAATGVTGADGFDLAAGSDSVAYIIQRENAAMVFRTNNIARMTIDADGNISIPGTITGTLSGNATTASSAPASDVPAQSKSMNQWVNTNSSPTFSQITLSGSDIINGWHFAHQSDANLVIHNGAGTIQWAASWTNGWGSDISLKKNITPLENSLDNILSLKPVRFEWKEHKPAPFNDEPTIGLIAQDLEKIYPEFVFLDYLTGKKFIKPAGLMAPLIGAVQELAKQISSVKITADSSAEKINILSQNTINQQKEIDMLKTEIESLKK